MTLADELSRNGRRSGLTFAPEGGSERIRKVINKMVTEDDLIRTVTTAYASGWRQVKLYFMCGLPTETDEDVLAIAEPGPAGDRGRPRGDRPPRHPVHGVHRRLRAQAAHPVPVGGPVRRARPWTTRLRALGAALRSDPGYGRAVGYRYHDGEPSIVEGLLSRGDRRVAAVIRAAWAGRGPVRRLERALLVRALGAAAPPQALAGEPVDLAWYTTRERDYGEVLPWDHLDAGLDRDWLWQDWQDAVDPAGGRGRGLPLDARVTTAGCARPWEPRSRPGRLAGRCSR